MWSGVIVDVPEDIKFFVIVEKWWSRQDGSHGDPALRPRMLAL